MAQRSISRRQFVKAVGAGTLAVGFCGLSFGTSRAQRAAKSPPTRIFHNAQVLTMEPGQPRAQALAAQDERILAVGGNEEILAQQAAETEIIDLEGKTLLPGFVDAHTHLFNDAKRHIFPDAETDQEAFAKAQQLALRNGITTLGDLFINPHYLNEMTVFSQADKLKVRTSLYLVHVDNCGRLAGDWYKRYQPGEELGPRLRVGGVKLFADGGTCGRPALSFEYPNGGRGELFLSQDEMNNAVNEIQEAGHQVAIHAVGDRAIEQSQNAIESALAGKANSFRHRIEHNSIIRPDLISRYGQIGIVPTLFGHYATCSEGWYGLFTRSDRLPWVRPYRTLLTENPGLHAAWHGDDPWLGPVNPLEELYGFVTRKQVTKDGTICEPPDWLAANTLPVQQALPLMNRGAAYALFQDEAVGSLKPGKFADLVVLSNNPLTVDSEAIREINVLMTVIGGQVEYRLEDSDGDGVPDDEDLCPDYPGRPEADGC